MAERVAAQVMALMESDTDAGEDELAPLAALSSASIVGRIASGPNAGQRPGMLGQFDEAPGAEEVQFQFDGPHCAQVSGFSVHAGVRLRPTDRKGLERLCRYGLRPPVAADRLALRPDG